MLTAPIRGTISAMIDYRKHPKKTTFYCFSPPVMLATFLFEIGAAVYILVRHKLSRVTVLAGLILICLALFQIAEWNVCEGAFGLSRMGWSKLGYVAITLLPPLGFHLLALIVREKKRWLMAVPYMVGAVFVWYFLAGTEAITESTCGGNYVIFHLQHSVISWYTLYYYGLLVVGVYYAFRHARLQRQQNIKRAVAGIGIGYLLFIVPTTLVVLLKPETIHGVPSVMCGFAVSLAAMLVAVTLPAYHGPARRK